jgi:hypothetical protein
MVVGVGMEGEHKKVQAQRAKSDLGKAFGNFLIAHSRVARQQAQQRARRRPVAKIKKNKKK